MPGDRRRLSSRSVVSVLAALAALAFGLLAGPAAAQGGGDDRASAAGPDVNAPAWILLDARDGHRLAARAPARRRAIASTTKLMTAYLALRELPLKRKLTVPDYAAAPAESVAGLTKGERLTVEDLLRALLLPSGNDAAETLALGVAENENAFVGEMNGAAAELGLERTSYSNPIGLDDPLNFSTASDLATLTMELREIELFREIVRLPEATLKSGSMKRVVTNSNTLLLSDPSVDGVKTGHTLDAGYVLVASAERHGVPLISVVLGAPSEAERDASSERLLDYGYSLYDPQRPFASGEEVGAAAVHYEDEPLALVTGRGFSVPARADQRIETDVQGPIEVEGPIAAGERLGKVTVTLDGEQVATVPLLAGRAVAEPGLVDRSGGPIALVAAAIVLIVILTFIALVLRHRRGGRGGDSRSSEDRMRSREERTLKRQDRGTPR